MSKPCKDCKSSILSQTPALIGSPKCNPDCPEETTCTDIIPGACVYYSGENLGCAKINYGDDLTTVIKKMDSRYGVRVTEDDNCCGFLVDKLISSDNTISITQSTQDNCQVLDLSTQTNCELEWLDIVLEAPFTTVPVPSGIPELEVQVPQYAVDPCSNKVWLRGTIYIPREVDPNTFVSFFTLPVTPLFGRAYLNIWNPQNNNGLIVSPLSILPDGSGGSYGTTNVTVEQLFGRQGYIFLDGFSFETN